MTSFTGVNICFYGLNRSLLFTIDSIRKNLLAPLKDQGCEISIFGAFCQIEKFSNTRSGEFDATPEQNEQSLLEFNALKYIDQSAFDDLTKWEEVFRFGDTYSQVNSDADIPTADSTTKNIFRSLFALKSSFSLVPINLRDRPTIFARLDMEILSDLNFDLYNLLLFKKAVKKSYGNTDGVALVPNWHSWHGLNDRFAICSPGNASEAYANRFDSLIPYIQLSRHPIHPETYLYQVMHAARVETLPVIATQMSRIRANGKPQDEDFLEGHQSVEPQSETINALNEIIKDEKRHKAEINKSMKELNLKVSAKCADLEKEKQERGAEAERLKTLEAELTRVMGERDEQAKEKSDAVQTIVELRQQVEQVSASLIEKQSEAKAASEEAKLKSLELQKTQEVLEKILDDHATQTQEKSDALQTIAELRQQVEQVSALLIEKQSEAKDASEETELTLLQLHQVQEELERYFNQSRDKDKLLDRHQAQQYRAKKLISKLLLKN